MITKVIKINPDNPEQEKIDIAAKALRSGKLVSFPTETVYGLGASLLNKKAIAKIYDVKKRPHNKPLPVAIAEKEKIEEFAKDILPAAYRLIDSFLPGPLTLILRSKEAIPFITLEDKVGIRMPNNIVAQRIIKRLGAPVVLTSANISGNDAVNTAEDVLKDLNGLISLVIDAGETVVGEESTVVDATIFPFNILRKGAIKEDEIEKVANNKTVLFVCTGNSCRSVMAKALLEKFIKGKKEVKVLSAGILPTLSVPTSETIKLLKEEDVDVSRYKPMLLNANMIKTSELILTMEKIQEQRVISLVPEAKNRVYLLKEFVNVNLDSLEIDDPISKGIDVYKDCFLDIKQAVTRVAELL